MIKINLKQLLASLLIGLFTTTANAANMTFVGLYEGNDGTADILTSIITDHLAGDTLTEVDRVDWNFGTVDEPFTNPQSDGGLTVTGTVFKGVPDTTEALEGTWSYMSTTQSIDFLTLKFDGVFAVWGIDGYILGENIGGTWDVDAFIGEEVRYTTDKNGDPLVYGDTWNKGKTKFALSHMTTYEVNVVPVPAAVWLMGSGLLGLVGVARRKTA